MRDHRLLVEAVIWRYRTGSPWRELPAEFGPWQTVWKRRARFATDGLCAADLRLGRVSVVRGAGSLILGG